MTWLDFLMEEWLLSSLLAVIVVVFLIVESRRGGTTVSHHQATRLINDGKAVFIDLRDSKEYKTGHIVDAINIPYSNLNTRLVELEKLKNKQLIVVDKMGQHAGAAGRLLREKGFTVVRLQGGMMEWLQQNLPVVKA